MSVVKIAKKASSPDTLLNISHESDSVKMVRDQLYDCLSNGIFPLPKGQIDDRNLEGTFLGTCDPTGDQLAGLAGTRPIPQCVLALVREAALDGDLSELEGFRVSYHVGFRNSQTVISPPQDDVISRVLFNIGNNEIYHFSAAGRHLEDLTQEVRDKVGSIPDGLRFDNKEIFIPKDSYVSLSYKSLCDYYITVRAKPPRDIPQSMNLDGKVSKPRIFMRPPSYHRITVVVDLLATKSAIRKVDRLVHRTVGNIQLSEIGRMAEEINEKLKSGEGLGHETEGQPGEPEKMTISKKERKEVKKKM